MVTDCADARFAPKICAGSEPASPSDHVLADSIVAKVLMARIGELQLFGRPGSQERGGRFLSQAMWVLDRDKSANSPPRGTWRVLRKVGMLLMRDWAQQGCHIFRPTRREQGSNHGNMTKHS